MTFKDVITLIKSDLYRYSGGGHFIKWYLICPGFKYTLFLRLTNYFSKKSRLAYPLFVASYLKLLLLSRHYGIQIPYNTTIGKGFYIGHFGTIVVNGAAIIGDNVNISQGVTIGVANRGERKGVATIGNCVYLGPGVKIVGKVKIGNNVAIGANAVVTKDIPDNAVCVGVPARVISYDGADGYITKTV